MLFLEQTSPTLGALAPRKLALLPVAATEQHGDHLPVGTDAMIGAELGRRLEAVFPDELLLLPALWLGSSHHHRDFPGTISLSSATYIQVLTEVLESLLASGFRRILLLNSHGGNHGPATEALYRLKVSGRTPEGALIGLATYWKIAAKAMQSETFMETPCLSHACEYETSLLLVLKAECVEMSRARGSQPLRNSSFYDPLGYGPSSAVFIETFAELSENGALGNPELATKEKGERLLEVYTRSLTAFIREFLTRKS